MKSKMKVYIPNILCLIRLVFTPIIIILCATKNYKIGLVLVILAAISDLFDGFLARKWNTVTSNGAKLDALCDKVFGIGLTIYLITKFKCFIPIVIFESIIGIFNLYVYFKNKSYKSIIIGKIKSVLLFITIVVGYFALFNKIYNVLFGFVIVTINLQFLALISYIINFYDSYKNKEIEESIVKDKTETRVKIYDIEEEENIYTNDEMHDNTLINNINDKKKKNKVTPKPYSNRYRRKKPDKTEEVDTNTKKLDHIKDIFLDKE